MTMTRIMIMNAGNDVFIIEDMIPYGRFDNIEFQVEGIDSWSNRGLESGQIMDELQSFILEC